MRAAALLAALLWVAALRVGAQDDAGQALLQRVRAHMVETLQRQPNYTCLETVERANRAGREKQFRVQDTVRLEVALVNGQEMFAWPGSKQFEDTDMRHFVPTGMFGSGDFGLYTKAVFAGTRTEIDYQGQSYLERRPAVRFDFHVPVETGMKIRDQDNTATVPYHGSFYVEPRTLDVLRLEVIADNLPRKLQLSEVTDTMEFARVRIGSDDFLLPSASEAQMIDLRAGASRNRIRFSECREFAGEATLKFGDDTEADAGTPAAAAKQEIPLPKNAVVALRLVDTIDTDKAAVGDPVKAALDADVKEKGRVLLPKGTAVAGRIVRLEHNATYTVLGFMFQEAESETAHAALDLSFDMATGPELVAPGTRWGTPVPVRPHEGLIAIRPGHVKLSRGMIFFWRS